MRPRVPSLPFNLPPESTSSIVNPAARRSPSRVPNAYFLISASEIGQVMFFLWLRDVASSAIYRLLFLERCPCAGSERLFRTSVLVGRRLSFLSILYISMPLIFSHISTHLFLMRCFAIPSAVLASVCRMALSHLTDVVAIKKLLPISQIRYGPGSRGYSYRNLSSLAKLAALLPRRTVCDPMGRTAA